MLQFSRRYSFSPPTAVIAITELTELLFPTTILSAQQKAVHSNSNMVCPLL